MRLSFRTTLEQELLEMLKRMAKEKNKNMNDILEEILYFYYGDEEQLTYFVPKMPDNYSGEKEQFLKDEIAYIAGKIFMKNGIEISDEFIEILKTVSLLMVELAERDSRLSRDGGGISVEDIVKNADSIKKILDDSTMK